MLSVETLARRIRKRLHDNDKITYDDDEILDCINCGIRFIRRLIANMRPALLMSEVEGVLPAGVKSITLENRPTKIICVLAGKPKKALEETELAFAIHERDTEDEPREFYLTGTQTINFFPTPNSPTEYVIRTVDDIDELAWEDKSPLNNEFDDFLVEYVSVRLSVGNEYDMTQESQMMSNIVAQIQKILMPPPAGIIVKGFWQ
ncbi:MAG: hypothetical protein IJL14_01010 [Selenomonadaceae bacterium]|nr:hypothetical protein [Selenomonadaceae bacterium]